MSMRKNPGILMGGAGMSMRKNPGICILCLRELQSSAVLQRHLRGRRNGKLKYKLVIFEL